MASMEMDVYLNGTEEEKEADASKIRDLAMEFFDGQKEAGNLPAESYCMTSVGTNCMKASTACLAEF